MRRLLPRLFIVTAAVVAAVTFSIHCADLNPLQPGVCGNGVVDPGEDCDSTSPSCGAPGTSDACRFNCAGTSVCPAGYNCGTDSICRAPSGQFVPLGSPLHTGGQEIALGDFNGDGFADAFIRDAIDNLGGASSQVVYLASDGSIEATFAIPDKLRSPAVIDVNADGLADLVGGLVVNSQNGVGVFLGQRAASVAPQPFPSTTLPSGDGGLKTAILAPIDGFAAGFDLAYFLGTSNGAVSRALYFPGQSPPGAQFGSGTTPIVEVPMPLGPADVAGQIAVTRLLPVRDACPDLVMVGQRPLNGDKVAKTYVIQPCAVGDGGTPSLATAGPAVTPIPFAPNVTGCVNAPGDCGTGAFAGDVNGDTFLDVVVTATTASGAEYATYVAYGDGDGDYGAIGGGGGNNGFVGPLALALADGNTATLGRTLAVADINGDGFADFVAEGGDQGQVADGPFHGVAVFLSHSEPDGGAIQYQKLLTGNGWFRAALADFNGDGKIDLIAAAPAIAELEFFTFSSLPDGYAVSLHAAITTEGDVDTFEVGDFDGDSIEDLAFVQADPARDGTRDVAILYGAPGSFPGVPVVAGRYPKVMGLAADPPFTSLAVVADPASADAGITVSLFNTGFAGRPPLASQALRAVGAASASGNIIGAAVGSFSASDAASDGSRPLDVVALGELADAGAPGVDTFWFLRNQGPITIASDGGATQFGISFGGPFPSLDASALTVDPLFAVFGIDQAILMTAASLHANDPASVVAVASCGDNAGTGCNILSSVLLVGTLQGSTIAPSGAGLVQFPYTPGGSGNVTTAEDGQIALVDLDGDGWKDLVLLTGTAGGSGFCANFESAATSGITRSLMVAWGVPTGGFDVASPTIVGSCQVCGDAPTGVCPGPFAALRTTPTGPPTLAYVGDAGLSFVSFHAAGASRTFTSTTPQQSVPGADAGEGGTDAGPLVAASPGFGGIAAGDINGDGVDDLAIVVKGNLYLYQGVAVIK